MLEHRLYRQSKSRMDEFINGFLSIIPRDNLKGFTSNELDLIICGLPDISIDDMGQNASSMDRTTKTHRQSETSSQF